MKSLMKKIVLMLVAIMMIMSVMSPAMAASYVGAKESAARMYVLMGVVTLDGEVVTVGGALGSCFAVGNKKNGPVKYFVTNRHVVSGDGETITIDYGGGLEIEHELMVLQAYIVFDNAQNLVPVNIEYIDEECDLAVVSLHTATTERKPITIRTMDPEEVSKKNVKIYTIGFPGETEDFLYYENITSLENQIYSSIADMTVSSGIISRVGQGGDTQRGEIYVIDADINHGNSGGPLVDENGNLLGVNTYGTEKFNYAISSNEVVRVLESRNIPYITYNPMRTLLIWAGIALVVIAAAVVVVLVIVKNKPVHGRALFGVKGTLEGQKFVLKRKMYIGRDSGKCAIVFPSQAPGVSKIHCCIGYNGKEVVVMDMNSKYGTWIDDHKLTPNTPTRLHRGHTLYIGSESEGLMLRNE